jgi:hypothetical protein
MTGVAGPAGVVAAMPSRPAPRSAMIAIRATVHRVDLGSRLGKRTADDVAVRVRMRVEARDRHEYDEEDGARKNERQMVKKEAAALIAIRFKLPNRRSDDRFHPWKRAQRIGPVRRATAVRTCTAPFLFLVHAKTSSSPPLATRGEPPALPHVSTPAPPWMDASARRTPV